jgi:hypothetical protein
MHDRGIVHHDLHPGNLLVRLGPDDLPEYFLIDLHAVQVRSPLSWRPSRANLVLLNRWFTLRATRTDRLRFWRTYCNARQLGGVASRYAVDLEERTGASNRAFWRTRDRRCLASNRYFQPVRSAAASGHAVRDLPHELLNTLLADPDAAFGWPGVKLLKDSRSSTVAEFEANVNGVPQRVIYKRFRVTSWSDPWKALVRRSPALRSWVYGHALRDRCQPTPRRFWFSIGAGSASPARVISSPRRRRRLWICTVSWPASLRCPRRSAAQSFVRRSTASPGSCANCTTADWPIAT